MENGGASVLSPVPGSDVVRHYKTPVCTLGCCGMPPLASAVPLRSYWELGQARAGLCLARLGGVCQWPLRLCTGWDSVRSGVEKPLKWGHAVWRSLDSSCKMQANPLACVCSSYLLQTALGALCGFIVISQLPETRQLLRLRQCAHGTTALIFLTALSGKAVSFCYPICGSFLCPVGIFRPDGDCEQPHGGFLWENFIAVRELTGKSPDWSFLSR